eukprot:6591026-Ditylum_brightwellii.AAC.1
MLLQRRGGEVKLCRTYNVGIGNVGIGDAARTIVVFKVGTGNDGYIVSMKDIALYDISFTTPRPYSSSSSSWVVVQGKIAS